MNLQVVLRVNQIKEKYIFLEIALSLTSRTFSCNVSSQQEWRA